MQLLGQIRGGNVLLRCGAVFLASVLAVNARPAGNLSGFGAAFAAALPKGEALAAVAGNLFGFLLFDVGSEQLTLFPALFLIVSAKFLFPRFSSKKAPPALCAVFSFGILLGCGIGASVVEEAGAVTLFFRFFEAALCAAGTYFAAVSYRVLSLKKEPSRYTTLEFFGVGATAAVLLLALCDIRLFTFSLGRIAGLLFVLVLVGQDGLPCAFAAAGTAAVFTLYSPDFAPYGGAMIAAAVAGNALRPLGKFGQISTFSVVNTCLSLLGGVGEGTFSYLLDAFFAASVVSVLPGDLLRWKGKEAGAETGKLFGRSDWLSGRLRFASFALQELRGSVGLVSERIRQNEPPEISSVFLKSADAVCLHCGLKVFCWETQREDTLRSLRSVVPLLKKEGKIREEEMPQYFRTKCCKCTVLTAAVNRYYQSYLSHCRAVRMAEEARQVSFEQLDGVAELLNEIGNEVGEIERIEEGWIEAISKLFRRYGLFPEELTCYVGKDGRMGVEGYLREEPKLSYAELCEELSSLLKVELELPVITRFGDWVRRSFFEMARYRVELFSGQLPALGERFCGDRYETFLGADGFFYFVLSDGMGSGNHAALDASMTCSFIMKLLKAGFGFASALRFVNASLFIKESEESLATIDLFRADLYTGQLEIFKAGAAPSFLVKGQTVRKIESDALPLGILRDTGFDCHRVTLSEGDLILMVSDGVTATGSDWIEAELERCGEKSVKEVAERIVNEARRRRIDGHSDDITAAAFRLKKAD